MGSIWSLDGTKWIEHKNAYLHRMKRYKVRVCIDKVFEIEAPDESEAKYGAWVELGYHPEDHGDAFIEAVENIDDEEK